MVRLPSIEARLGTTVDQADEAAITALMGVDEDQDLDFKQDVYPSSDAGRNGLATDAAAMANTAGGLIVIGVAEADGRATGTTPVPIGEGEVLRMRQVLASLVAPPVDVDIRRVESTASVGTAYILLAIARSDRAPHAVRRNHALAYPVRDGASTRYLSESEVATTYRNRFEAGRERLARLHDVDSEGVGILGLRDRTYLAMALAPVTPGRGRITADQVATVDAWQARFTSLAMPFTAFQTVIGARMTTGLRRYVLEDVEWVTGRSLALGKYAEYHADGSGFAALMGESREEGPYTTSDEQLVSEVVTLLRLLVEAAVLVAGSGGDAVLRTSLRLPRMPDSGQPDAGLQIVQSRGDFGTRPIVGTRVVMRDTIVDSTVDVGAVHGSMAETMRAAALIANDLVTAFGLAEQKQISRDGTLLATGFNSTRRGEVERWASANSVDFLPLVRR
jgi:hypothetical protein